MQKIYGLAIAGIIVIMMVALFSGLRLKPKETTQPVPPQSSEQPTTQTVEPETKLLRAQDITGADKDFQFSGRVPAVWQAEALTAIQSLNIYNPESPEQTNLEKSQIFIRKFTANEFLTLSTVTIHSRVETTINERPAVRYEIEKKVGIADFAYQPSWRNRRHIVTDVRVSDTDPSVFYVIAKRPDLDDATYQQFLTTFSVIMKTTLQEPIDEFAKRITKKTFGLLVTPTNSPVEPERFNGYHTGVDVEYDDKPNEEISVRAIADGEVVRALTAPGYGGVLVVKHSMNGKPRAVIYGHLNPASIPKQGSKVTAGQAIGILGEGATTQTDGERKHLHFGVRVDDSADIRGYVQDKEGLAGWIDSLELY